MFGALRARLGGLMLLGLVSGCSAAPMPESAAEARAFFRGRTLIYVVATEPGGSYDTYGRLLSRHFARHARS